MKTNITLKSIAFLYTAGSLMPLSAQEGQQERPNFVWFMTEDVSKHYLSLYNEGKCGAVTPNVERLMKSLFLIMLIVMLLLVRRHVLL